MGLGTARRDAGRLRLRCAARRRRSPDFREFLPGLLQGARSPSRSRLSARPLAVVAGLLAALARCTARRRCAGSPSAYVEIFRGTSALVQLFWLFFVLPHFGITLEPFTVAVLALGLNVGAYGAEVVRGAIAGVPRGQWEATTALNMTRAAGAAAHHPAAGDRRA